MMEYRVRQKYEEKKLLSFATHYSDIPVLHHSGFCFLPFATKAQAIEAAPLA
jgi:hypothetical protein